MAFYLPLSVIAVMSLFSESLPPEMQGRIALIAGAVAVVAGFAQLFLLKCPACSKSIDPQLRIKYLRPINYCPYCGVSLDSQSRR
ncbi:hypothetical protein [Niveibacterium umoris]|uniref:Uncharacterized protein n=1 Tax=Niveibacterium umoris TaxID=1193620 RepID=A0A840BU71_9RHOO|nr:hypothetical protein [Niveibacterium umoris]MBB4014939.1 hypothetical protein [Niveibacterium umoris]